MSQNLRVLIIGVNQSLVWNTSRSLSLEGIKPIVLASQSIAPIKLSSDCAQYIHWTNATLTDGLINIDALDQVEDICTKKQIDIVLPADHESTILLSNITDNQKIPVCKTPDRETINKLHDKWELYQILRKLKLPCPETEYITSPNNLLNTQLTFPIITKPSRGWASVGFEVHQSKEVLATKINNDSLKSAYPLLAQTLAEGYDVGLSFIADNGDIVAYCMFYTSKKRVRTFFDDPVFLNIISEIVKATHYTGVGNWDAIYNPQTGEYKILELNPRFWASMLYATNAKINFPYHLVNTHLWNSKAPVKAKLGTFSTTTYERCMSILTRLSNKAYNAIGK